MLDLSTLTVSDQAVLAQLLLKAGAGDDPLAKAKPTRAKKRGGSEIKYLTEHEIERLFKCIDSSRDRAIFRLMYHRGLRASEIGMIQLEDWIVKDDRLIVRRLKGSAGGEYHLCKSEIKALREWVKARGNDSGPLFPSSRGTAISRQMLDCLMKHYGAAAGIPAEKRHCHALKHSCGTHLLNKGESIEDVQDHLGHRQVANTLVYAKYTNKRRHERDRRLRDW